MTQTRVADGVGPQGSQEHGKGYRPDREKLREIVVDVRLVCQEIPEEAQTASVRLAAVWVEDRGFHYALNGTAKTWLPELRSDARIRDLESIWRVAWPPGYRVSVTGLINRGLALCAS